MSAPTSGMSREVAVARVRAELAAHAGATHVEFSSANGISRFVVRADVVRPHVPLPDDDPVDGYVPEFDILHRCEGAEWVDVFHQFWDGLSQWSNFVVDGDGNVTIPDDDDDDETLVDVPEDGERAR